MRDAAQVAIVTLRPNRWTHISPGRISHGWSRRRWNRPHNHL